jgi:hypothetical protein
MVKNLLRNVPTIKMNDLQVNFDYGWAFQGEVTPYEYSDVYWQNYIQMENTETCKLLNNFRKSLVESYATNVLDIGIGSGAFLKSLSIPKKGYDVNPHAEKWLKEQEIWHNPYEDSNASVDGFCFWDVLEHIENPSIILNNLPNKSFVFISLPIFNDLEKIHLSKHYKPNEHLQYFSTSGLMRFLGLHGFRTLEIRSDESQIGRENIITFVAQKHS